MPREPGDYTFALVHITILGALIIAYKCAEGWKATIEALEGDHKCLWSTSGHFARYAAVDTALSALAHGEVVID